ncbi:MAG TPA: MerR family transcriptional regulator [Flavisolibacter sp.]|jgi:DNA-binding transcriptional MerR regulator
MSKSLTQITLEFFGQAEEPKEFLSDQPVEPEKQQQQQPQPPQSLQQPKHAGRGRKALKDIAAELDQVDVPEDEVLFQKQYYSIGEVATMFHVNTSLIRYWENEFDVLDPRKNRKGDRFFKPADVKNLQLIYDLLRRRKFTIEGAKDYLKKNSHARERYEMIQSMQKVKAFLLELKASL